MKKLISGVPLQVDSRQQGDYHYFDTFDWRLYRQSYHLYLLEHTLYLYDFSRHITEFEQSISIDIEKSHYIPSELLDGKILSLIQIRTLVQVATINTYVERYSLKNKEGKTTVRVRLEKSKIRVGNRFMMIDPQLKIYPLRGYSKNSQALLKKLPADKIIVSKDDLLKRGLEVINKSPADYSSKMMIDLSKNQTAREAMSHIYLSLLNMMIKNEEGIKKDIDTEFLHDFRVAIRRTRSALSQIKGVFEKEVLKKFKHDFNFLGRSTNLLRDIDVYLLKEYQYKQILPPDFRRQINPFFTGLKRQRKSKHQSLVKMLDSVEYKRIKEDWEYYLRDQSTEISKKKDKDVLILDIAKRVIRKRNGKILTLGEKILLNSDDKLLHQLRIEGKKLRYLLEFFSSLFPKDRMQLLITKLKQLQDILGEFNDLCVQQDKLKDFAIYLSSGSNDNSETILALGILIGKLNERKSEVKKSFTDNFINFAASDTQKKIRELFGISVRGVK